MYNNGEFDSSGVARLKIHVFVVVAFDIVYALPMFDEVVAL